MWGRVRRCHRRRAAAARGALPPSPPPPVPPLPPMLPAAVRWPPRLWCRQLLASASSVCPAKSSACRQLAPCSCWVPAVLPCCLQVQPLLAALANPGVVQDGPHLVTLPTPLCIQRLRAFSDSVHSATCLICPIASLLLATENARPSSTAGRPGPGRDRRRCHRPPEAETGPLPARGLPDAAQLQRDRFHRAEVVLAPSGGPAAALEGGGDLHEAPPPGTALMTGLTRLPRPLTGAPRVPAP